MKKRIFAFILCLVMVFGLFPGLTQVQAADLAVETAALAGHPAAYAETVTLDGSAAEPDWVLSGKLSDKSSFGFLWNRDALYLALENAETPVLKFNGTAYTPAAANMTADTVQEIMIPLADLGLTVSGGETVEVEITCGEAVFAGTVELDPLNRSLVPVCKQDGTQYGNVDNIGYEFENGTYHMWNTYNAQSTSGNGTGGRVYAVFGSVTPLAAVNQAHVVEFDFKADSLPEIKPAWTGNYSYTTYGFAMLAQEGSGKGYAVGIANSADGLTFCVNPISGGSYKTALIGKALGEEFHVRLEQDPTGDLYVYIDDQLILTYEKAGQMAGASTQQVVMNLWNGSTSGITLTADGKNDTDFTVSNLITGSKELPAGLLANMNFGDICGSNITADEVSSDLELPATISGEILSDVALTWSSSHPSVISEEGKVTLPAAPTTVTLTAALTDAPTVTKDFAITVVADVTKAYITLDAITADGVLEEPVWHSTQLTVPLSITDGDVTGDVTNLYAAGKLYLGIAYENAASAEITVADKTWTVDLAAAISDGALTGAATDTAAELVIDLNAAGIYLSNYEVPVAYQIKLTGESGSAALASEGGQLVFCGHVISDKMGVQTQTIHADVVVTKNAAGRIISYGFDTASSRLYAIGSKTDLLPELTWEGGALHEMTLNVSRMSDSTGAYVNMSNNLGGTFVLGDKNDSGLYGTCAILWNNDGELTLNLFSSSSKKNNIPLGVGLDETFVLGTQWLSDGSAVVLVNGSPVGTVSNAKIDVKASGSNEKIAVNAAGNTAFVQSSSILIGHNVYTSVGEEISPEVVFGEQDLSFVINDLTLPTSFQSEHLGQINLRWESSDESVIAADGTVTRSKEADKTVTLTLFAEGVEEALWSVDVTVPMYQLFSASVTLADSLTFNFYVYQHDVSADVSYAEVALNGETTTIPKSQWGSANGTLGAMYRISFTGLTAKQMADDLTITLFDSNGQMVGEPSTDSIRTYCMRVFGRGQDNLMVDMLNYGAAAQDEFAYRTDDPANSLLSEEQQALATESVTMADLRTSTGSYYGTSLTLKNRIALNFYFSGVTEDMTAQLIWSDHYGNDESTTAPIVMSGAYGCVTVTNLAVADAFQPVTCVITDTDGNEIATVTDSVESYCARTLSSQPLNEPLMKFADAAYRNFHPTSFTNVILHLGADESQLNFTWYCDEEGESTITYAPTADMKGRHFPEDAATVTATPSASVKDGYYASMATISGLEPDTSYTYQLAAGDERSIPQSFTTAPSDVFTFAVVGDAQIGRGQVNDLYCPEGLQADYDAWDRTLNQIATDEHFAGARFLLSMGDQINSNYINGGNAFSYAAHENQFDHFANHEVLLRLPMAATYGNHDSYAYSVYGYHFNQPNRDASAGIDYDDAVTTQVNTTDYYFVYNNILFLVLNNLDITSHQEYTDANKAAIQAHCDFVDRAIEETKDQDIQWKIVMYHASPYGSSYHNDYTMKDGKYTRTEQYSFVKLRQYLIPHLYEAGVDLILSGHDHTYSRTYVIKPGQDENGNYIDEAIITHDFSDGNTVTNPDGIIHVTASTSSGSAINIPYFTHSYTAIKAQANERQAIRIDVTDNSLTLVNYNLGTRTSDSITEIDRITIYRTQAE